METVTLTAGDMAAATAGEILQGSPAMTIGGISIDSRKLGAGDFFVAIRGERFDGHQFVGDVLARGASGVLLDTLPGDLASHRDGAANAPVLIRAKDTTVALQAVARHVRRLAGCRVVAITGSAGKTTTKEVTAELLSAPVPGVQKQGESQQPHRPSVVAPRAAGQAGCGGRRTGHESPR